MTPWLIALVLYACGAVVQSWLLARAWERVASRITLPEPNWKMTAAFALFWPFTLALVLSARAYAEDLCERTADRPMTPRDIVAHQDASLAEMGAAGAAKQRFLERAAKAPRAAHFEPPPHVCGQCGKTEPREGYGGKPGWYAATIAAEWVERLDPGEPEPERKSALPWQSPGSVEACCKEHLLALLPAKVEACEPFKVASRACACGGNHP